MGDWVQQVSQKDGSLDFVLHDHVESAISRLTASCNLRDQDT